MEIGRITPSDVHKDRVQVKFEVYIRYWWI